MESNIAEPHTIVAEASIGQVEYLKQIQSVNEGQRPPYMQVELQRLSIDLPALERTIAFLVERHESLRTVFPNIDGHIKQVVKPFSVEEFGLEIIDCGDLSSVPDGSKQPYFKKAVAGFSDIGKGPLVKFFLFGTSDDLYDFSMLIHHIICDEWSLNILKNELYAAYQAFVMETEPELPPLRWHLRDYSKQQNTWLRQNTAEISTFWKDKLEKFYNQLFDAGLYYKGYLSRNDPRLAIQLPEKKEHTRRELLKLLDTQDAVSYITVVTGECYKHIKKLSQNNGYSIAAIIYTSLYIFLNLYTGKRKILMASLVADRLTQDKQKLVGCLLGAIYIPRELSPDAEVNHAIEETYRNLLINADNLIFDHDILGIDGQKLRAACDMYVNYIGQKGSVVSKDILPAKVHLADVDIYYAINCQILEFDNGFAFRWRYNKHLFDHKVIEDMADCYDIVLSSVGEYPTLTVEDLINLVRQRATAL